MLASDEFYTQAQRELQSAYDSEMLSDVAVQDIERVMTENVN